MSDALPRPTRAGEVDGRQVAIFDGLLPAAQVVARALQKYGMLMADGGNITLTAQSDQLSTVKWADVGFDANSLQALKATDFEVIDYGTPTDVNFNCTRQQIIEP